MDETAVVSGDRPDGFERQRLCVVPRPLVESALSRPVTRRVTVTDAGYFPVALGHRLARASGAPEVIVILCVAGAGIVRIEDAEYEVARGTCIAIPSGLAHSYFASDVDPWTIWWMHMRGTDVSELAGPLLGVSRAATRLRAIEGVAALFDELVALMERGLSPAHLLAASGIASHLLTRVATASMLPAEGSPLERAMHFLETRVESNIPVGELAALVGISPSHLTALFRRATGGGPSAFHTGLKMAQARSLLDTTTLSIAEISDSVGYRDPLYFSRRFRSLHGTSPTAYRATPKG